MKKVIRTPEQLKQAKEELKLLRKAWEKILTGGQEYEIDTNRMKRADLKEISEQISAYESAIDSYERHGAKGTRRRAVPID